MRVRVIAIAASVVLSAIVPVRALACTCTELPPVCQAYWEASTVFVGTATDANVVDVPIGQGTDTYQQLLVRFSVEEPFRGVAGSTEEIYTAPIDTLCGYPFAVGTQYLVYANANGSGRVVTSLCTRTRPAAAAGEDLAYIRGLSQSDTAGKVYGVALLYSGSGSTGSLGPLENMNVVVIDGQRRFSATTDASGKFEVTDVPVGTYRVRVKLPSGAGTDYRGKVTVNPAGCSRLSIEAHVREKSNSPNGLE